MRTFRGGLLIGLAVAVAVAAVAAAYELYDTRTLKRTVRRGEVLCGVNKGLPGFSIPDDKGNWNGFDVDFCRAVAAAIFDDPKKAKFIPVPTIPAIIESRLSMFKPERSKHIVSFAQETVIDLFWLS